MTMQKAAAGDGMVGAGLADCGRIAEHSGIVAVERYGEELAMTVTAPKARVIHETVDDSSRRLRTFIARMEHRYECPSEELLDSLAAGTIRETAEVSRWLAALDFLRDLTAHGRTTGTLTRSIK
jgi:hypothetical protein